MLTVRWLGYTQADRIVLMACLYPISTFMEYTWTEYEILGDFQRYYTVKGQLCHELRSVFQ